MVGAPVRRRQVAYANQRGLSVRRACALMSVARSTLRYESRLIKRDAPAVAVMRELAAQPIRGNHWDVGKTYVGKKITWEQPNQSDRNARNLVSIDSTRLAHYANEEGRRSTESLLVKNMTTVLEKRIFRRIAAERDVRPEPESDLRPIRVQRRRTAGRLLPQGRRLSESAHWA
jgi:hypothetical protein